jgi:hypothetical protein
MREPTRKRGAEWEHSPRLYLSVATRIGAMEFWADLGHELIRLKPSKLPYFQQGLRAMTLIQSAL